MASLTVFRLTRVAAIAVVVLFGIAMLSYPGGTGLNRSTRGYSIFHNSLSDLGASVAWNGQPNPGAVFNLAASILLVLAGVACLVVLIRVCSSSIATRRIGRAAAAIVLVAAAALIGAAFSPQDRAAALHGRFTLVAVCSFPVATVLLALITALDGRFRRRAPAAWLVLTVVVITWGMVIRWRPTTEVEAAIPVILQKIVGIVLLGTLVLESREAERVVARRGRDTPRHRLASDGR